MTERVLNREDSEQFNPDSGEVEDSDDFDIEYYISLAEIDGGWDHD